MDQRESLRTMLAQHHPSPISDDRLVAFKLAVARELAPFASGFLIDRDYGFAEVVAQGLLPATSGLILAVDVLDQPPGGVVEDTDVEEQVEPGPAVALKLLVTPIQATANADLQALHRTGATGLEPATSGVTGRYGLNRHRRLPSRTTGRSRQFVPNRTGCDRPRLAAARQRPCSTRVVERRGDVRFLGATPATAQGSDAHGDQQRARCPQILPPAASVDQSAAAQAS